VKGNPSTKKKEHYRRVERSLSVLGGVTVQEIKAHYREGVLELTIPTPKVEKPKAMDVKIA
jgi:HSP20 family molecular chaperone IbpA